MCQSPYYNQNENSYQAITSNLANQHPLKK